uniref:Beta-glucuronidase n=2 Tax=Timema TaxID=61471 RepID=A0A7R8VD40_TIMDO|nr:unnamed protein product [Timema douglasi]
MSTTTTIYAYALLLLRSGVTLARISSGGILYPQESESRDVRTLDGVWNFRLSPESDPLVGFREHWYNKELRQTGETIPMPVPASYNDITQDKAIRDHVGLVWYDRSFFVPDTWRQQGLRVWMRFDSVSYAAQVVSWRTDIHCRSTIGHRISWVNGQLVMSHEIGHLPFQRDIASVLKYGSKNLVTVAVDNTLLETSIPQGQLSETYTDNGTQITQSYTFDFFNYAGIHRHVHLYTTPQVYIDDISVRTSITGNTGVIEYNVSYNGYDQSYSSPLCFVDLLDKEGKFVARDITTLAGRIEISSPRLWWPYLMDSEPGYLYTLQVRLASPQLGTKDVYRLPVGIRTIRGKGLDYSLVAKDYNLIKWIGANSFRTSHYPYAEEIMDFADRQGIVVINECPSVDTVGFSSILLQKHKDSLSELIRRDKNRPSVIMWSIANEARTHLPAAGPYFNIPVYLCTDLFEVKTNYLSLFPKAQYVDIIGFNRYNGWYSNPGRTNTIVNNLIDEVQNWHRNFNKPIVIMEYGADTMPGLHLQPSYIWSEEYQVELFSEHFRAFDILRKKGYFVGEMIWNFADFKTAETYTRVGGNKKGVFTRDRQPKSSAHHVRRRYLALAEELDNFSPPQDAYPYISYQSYRDKRKNEL